MLLSKFGQSCCHGATRPSFNFYCPIPLSNILYTIMELGLAVGCTIFSKCSQIKPMFLHSVCISEIRSHAKGDNILSFRTPIQIQYRCSSCNLRPFLVKISHTSPNMVWTSIRYQKIQDPCARLRELYLYCICNAVLKLNMLSLFLSLHSCDCNLTLRYMGYF